MDPFHYATLVMQLNGMMLVLVGYEAADEDTMALGMFFTVMGCVWPFTLGF